MKKKNETEIELETMGKRMRAQMKKTIREAQKEMGRVIKNKE